MGVMQPIASHDAANRIDAADRIAHHAIGVTPVAWRHAISVTCNPMRAGAPRRRQLLPVHDGRGQCQ
jgi:hypothetical protein